MVEDVDGGEVHAVLHRQHARDPHDVQAVQPSCEQVRADRYIDADDVAADLGDLLSGGGRVGPACRAGLWGHTWRVDSVSAGHAAPTSESFSSPSAYTANPARNLATRARADRSPRTPALHSTRPSPASCLLPGDR